MLASDNVPWDQFTLVQKKVFVLFFGNRPSSDHHCGSAMTFFNVHPQHCSPLSHPHDFVEGSVYIVIPLRHPSRQNFKANYLLARFLTATDDWSGFLLLVSLITESMPKDITCPDVQVE
jgi:hypothetical protein